VLWNTISERIELNSGKNFKLQSASRKHTLGEKKDRPSKEVLPAIDCQEMINIPNPLVSAEITIPNSIYPLDRPPGRRVFVDNLNIMIKSEREFIGVKRCKIKYLFQIVILLHILTKYENVELPISDDKQQQIALIRVLIKLEISVSTTKFPTYKLAKTLDFNTDNKILGPLVSHTKRNYEILITMRYYPKANETIDYMIHVCYGQIESLH
jgi:hypothetical protein